MVPDLGARRDAVAGAERCGRDLRKSLPRSARLRAHLQCRPHLNHRPLAGNVNEEYNTILLWPHWSELVPYIIKLQL